MSAGEPVWLRKDVLLALHRLLLAEHGGAEGIRDEGLLDSALARPRQRHTYETTDIVVFAASYGFGLIKNHAFVDGNKRIAAMASILFLELNDQAFIGTEAEVASLFEMLAAGDVGEGELADWLRANARPTDARPR
jgi:death on curing protein